MIVPGTLLMVSALPSVLNVAVPAVTVGPVGFAFAATLKQEATAAASARRFKPVRVLRAIGFPPQESSGGEFLVVRLVRGNPLHAGGTTIAAIPLSNSEVFMHLQQFQQWRGKQEGKMGY